MLGRIERSKRVVEMIEMVDGVRERGHDTHLHVIGPTVDEEYRREVEALASDREYVYLEGELPREELVDRVCSHRYGLHAKEFEHFGMAVAELAAGGAVPFVPNDGGQHAIVDDREELLYESPADAVEKMDRVLSNPDLQRDLRKRPEEIRRRFGPERFREEFRAAVDESLGRSTDATAETSPDLSEVPGRAD
ncbi:glycosyltransferase [Halomicrococcus sp. SG-WS-1]|uniref:glycosyltransferase n=1 Tax=Halomicrococcus sp. SG-WS-1 TaxID=3439057 RepID=UPI003F79B08C